MKVISRDKCLVTGKADLEHLYTFRNFPVFMGCVENTPLEEDLRSDMSWWISREAGLIQLNPIPALESIYPASHGSGTIGRIWESHHIEFAEFILNNAGNNILEIGGGHGFLPQYCLKKLPDSKWTLIDPNPTCESSHRFEVIRGFFPIPDSKKYNTIIHSHLFEHMLDPIDFCKKIYSDLEDGGKLIFSVPNLSEMFKHQYTNILNFEHTFFLSDYFVEYFLELTGFRIIQTRKYLGDHSVFYLAEKQSLQKQHPDLINQYDENLKLYRDYIQFHESLTSQINDEIKMAAGKVFLFGGHVMSQFLLAFGIDKTKVACIIDNDPNKWQKRLSGTDLLVNSPEVIEDEIAPMVILRAGTFQKEISAQLRSINSSVIIVD